MSVDETTASALRGDEGRPDVSGRVAAGVDSSLLQCGLRVLLLGFLLTTLILEPPRNDLWICVSGLVVYAVLVGGWSAWALRPSVHDLPASTVDRVTLVMLGIDIAGVGVLAVFTGLTSQEDWTSDVLRTGLFLIPLIAAAQLSPRVSTQVAAPTVAALVVVSWITKSANQEPWPSIILSAAILAVLAAGSVALSRIQRARVDMIEDLARQRSQLLQELLVLEKHERQELAERVHDGALQYVIVARQDMEDVRAGDDQSIPRVETALSEATRLLRDVARELHPEVLARLGVKAALLQLATVLNERPGLRVEVDAGEWTDGGNGDVDYVLFSAARELLTNAVKHARAQVITVRLRRCGNDVELVVADDGVGISQDVVAQRQREGHLGLSSIRTKISAAGGRFDIGAASPGTRMAIRIPAA